MVRLDRMAVVLALWGVPGLGAPGVRGDDTPVRIEVDVHLAAPPAVPQEAPPPAHHRRGPRRGVEAPRPPPPDWVEPGAPPRGHVAGAFAVPPDRVPGEGLCRIWYDDLPPDRQPPPMSCDRAHHLARRHGGRVIWSEPGGARPDGRVASASYGPVDFRGVPPDRLPPPGTCRVWLDGVPPDRQPPPGPCTHAQRDAQRTGGRLLYMPGP
jgi:hypothetical protein